MEKENIKFGLVQHFPKHQWRKDNPYLKTCLKVIEYHLHNHGKTVRTAFLNMKAFLQSINIWDNVECEETYDSILEEDPTNLNAWIGLHECTASPERQRTCEMNIDTLMLPEKQKTVVPKALLEIGLSLCLLIPRYNIYDLPPTNQSESKAILSLDSYGNLQFITDKADLEVDSYIDTNIAQKRRVYNSICYLKEGLFRLQLYQSQGDQTVWKFFMGMAYNRLDNWIAYSNGSQDLRKHFTLKSLELFSELAVNLDPNAGDKPSKMYFQRCLAYIGQILVTRKNLIMHGEDKDYLPECFQKFKQHFIRKLWENPTEAFDRAKEYGFDTVVYTRDAKRLLHEGKYESVINNVDEIFKRDTGVHWYAASIRMTAYKLIHLEDFKTAKKSNDFSRLTPDLLHKAEIDGKYCFETFATANDVSKYATILLWLGVFPNGETVKDKNKIRAALNVLNRLYIEQGCHNHFKIHKTRAECHSYLGELDEAIKYSIWSINTSTGYLETLPIAFSKLIEFLLEKIQQKQNPSMENDQKLAIFKQIKYYTENEIKLCHEIIQKHHGLLEAGPFHKVTLLREKYDYTILREARETLKSSSDTQQNRIVESINNRYEAIFSVLRKSCTNHAENMKCFLDVYAEFVTETVLPTLGSMCLKCLGKYHKDWTQEYNRRWKRRPANMYTRLELCSPALDESPNVSKYDFLVIHAPEDKDWISYTFLPEMEDRPKQFRGCIPDRDFQKGFTFEENVKKNLAKTNKVLLVLTSKFFERIYLDCKFIEEIGQMHDNRTIDVINIFAEDIPLDKDECDKLIRFENVDVSKHGYNWNSLRTLLLRDLPSSSIKRPAVIWEDDRNHCVKPRGKIFSQNMMMINTDVLKKISFLMGYRKQCTYFTERICIIGYDGERKVPRWVAHKIDRHVKRGVVSRKSHHKQLRNYAQDLHVPPQARASPKDYHESKEITLGHLTPIADHSSSLERAKDVNVMTNMAPEVKDNFLWNRLEEYCRDSLPEKFTTVRVISGTLFLTKNAREQLQQNHRENSTLFTDTSAGDCTQGIKDMQLTMPNQTAKPSSRRSTVEYETVGRNEVGVPTDFFKIIIAKSDENPNEDPEIGAFVVPNQALCDADLDEMSVAISWLESKLGLDLCRNLRKDLKSKKLSTLTTPFFPVQDRMRKMIRYVNNLNDLQDIWNRVQPEHKAELQSVYKEKQQQLQSKAEK